MNDLIWMLRIYFGGYRKVKTDENNVKLVCSYHMIAGFILHSDNVPTNLLRQVAQICGSH